MRGADVEALDVALREVLTLYDKASLSNDPHGLSSSPSASSSDGQGFSLGKSESSSAEADMSDAERSRVVAVARMLVDVDLRARRRGMKRVETYLSNSQDVGEMQMLRVWQTLYYAAWLSDKVAVQREFFVRCAVLNRRLRSHSLKVLFFKSFFNVLTREWAALDRHRTNKFLLMLRIFFAEWISVVKALGAESPVSHHSMPVSSLRLLLCLSVSSSWLESQRSSGASFQRFGIAHLQFALESSSMIAEEVLLNPQARGIALHLVDIFVSELREGLAHGSTDSPAAAEGEVQTASSVGSLDLEKAEANAACSQDLEAVFSCVIRPFLRAAVHSKDNSLVANIHSKILRSLPSSLLDLRVVSAALFKIATNSLVRNENSKRFFESYEYLNLQVEAAREFFQGAKSAELAGERIANAVFSNVETNQNPDPPDEPTSGGETAVKPSPLNSVKKSAKERLKRKKTTFCDGEGGAKGAFAEQLVRHSDSGGEENREKSEGHSHADQAAEGAERAKKKRRIRSESSGNGIESDSSSSVPVALNEAALEGFPEVRCLKRKGIRRTKKMTAGESVDLEDKTTLPEAAASSASSEAETRGAAHNSETASAFSVNASSFHQEKQPPSQSDDSSAASTAPDSRSSENGVSAISSASSLPLRRRVKRPEPAPGTKRVLFNLKFNKVVAFSRHAPSNAVGPASGLASSGTLTSPSRASSVGSAKGSSSLVSSAAPRRGILRPAKPIGPPTEEELREEALAVRNKATRLLKNKKGMISVEDFMAVVRRALAQRIRKSATGKAGKRKKIQRVKTAVGNGTKEATKIPSRAKKILTRYEESVV